MLRCEDCAPSFVSFEYDGLPAPVAHRPGTGQAQVGNHVAQMVDGATTRYALDVPADYPK
jgi:hypothetical protein